MWASAPEVPLAPGYGHRVDERRRRGLERLASVLVLAESDMRQAAAAARHLGAFGGAMHGDAERALWTGMIVSYARPFLPSNKAGVVPDRLATPRDPEQRALHGRLREVRDRIVAHNDATSARQAVKASEELGFGTGYVEAWVPFLDEALPPVEALAEAQEAAFRKRRHEIEVELAEDP